MGVTYGIKTDKCVYIIQFFHEEMKKSQDERRKNYNKALVCSHVGKKHPAKKEDKCWELEKNKASHPDN
jgi:hypothetical protein